MRWVRCGTRSLVIQRSTVFGSTPPHSLNAPFSRTSAQPSPRRPNEHRGRRHAARLPPYRSHPGSAGHVAGERDSPPRHADEATTARHYMQRIHVTPDVRVVIDQLVTQASEEVSPEGKSEWKRECGERRRAPDPQNSAVGTLRVAVAVGFGRSLWTKLVGLDDLVPDLVRRLVAVCNALRVFGLVWMPKWRVKGDLSTDSDTDGKR